MVLTKKLNKMKNHTFQEAMDIFAKMFEGWNMVDSNGNKRPITSASPDKGVATCKGFRFGILGCSHIEQTKPMNGDEVWAYDDEKNKAIGVQARYIGTTSNGYHLCEENDGDIEMYRHVELIAPFKTLTIEEAEKILSELTKENYKITR